MHEPSPHATRRASLATIVCALVLCMSLAVPIAANDADAAEEAASRFVWEIPADSWPEQPRLLNRLFGALVGPEADGATLIATYTYDDGRLFRLRSASAQLWYQPMEEWISTTMIARQADIMSRKLEAMKRGDDRFLDLPGALDPEASTLVHDVDRHTIVLDMLVESEARQTRLVHVVVFSRWALLRLQIEVPQDQIEPSRASIDAIVESLAVKDYAAPGGAGWRGISPQLLGAMIGAAFGIVLTIANSIQRARRRRQV